MLANPWASDGMSRASAYGISFEKDGGEEDDDDDDSSTGSVNLQVRSQVSNSQVRQMDFDGSLPLLSPAAILDTTTKNNHEEEKDNAVSLSFYSDLVKK